MEDLKNWSSVRIKNTQQKYTRVCTVQPVSNDLLTVCAVSPSFTFLRETIHNLRFKMIALISNITWFSEFSLASHTTLNKHVQKNKLYCCTTCTHRKFPASWCFSISSTNKNMSLWGKQEQLYIILAAILTGRKAAALRFSHHQHSQFIVSKAQLILCSRHLKINLLFL